MLAAIQNVLNRLPRPVWSALALLVGAGFAYAATVAWGDATADIAVRLVAAMYSLAFVYAARRGDWRILRRLANAIRRYLWRTFLVTMFVGIIGALVAPCLMPKRSRHAASPASFLKQSGLGLLQYAQDYDDHLPAQMQTSAMVSALSPYTKSDALLLNPKTKLPFVWRNSVRGLYIKDVINARDVVVAYEMLPDTFPDSQKGKRLVLFLDGTVKQTKDDDLATELFVRPKHALKTKGSVP